MKQILSSWLFSPGAICVIFFLIGYLATPNYQSSNSFSTGSPITFSLPDPKPQDDAALLRQQQELAQETLQSRIRLLQNPNNCDQTRTLMVQRSVSSVVGATAFEQFAREFHLLSAALQVAVSTRRALVLADDWKLLPSNKETDCIQQNVTMRVSPSSTIETGFKGISCLQQSTLLNCNSSGKKSSSQNQQHLHLDHSLSFGILPTEQRETENSLFNVEFYGPELSVDMPQWPFSRATMLIDTLPVWERSKGRFWVRSQIVHYIWERWQNNAVDSDPYKRITIPEGNILPSIAFYWSSSKRLRKNLAVKFGRNASVTQDFGRYMQVAETIREQYFPQVKTIYLITDCAEEIPIPQNLDRKWRGWDFVLPFADTEKIMGQEMKILASIEIMRQAHFLVGSFQSQVFRLASELNAAWFAGKYPVNTPRHWPLDVEWFENP